MWSSGGAPVRVWMRNRPTNHQMVACIVFYMTDPSRSKLLYRFDMLERPLSFSSTLLSPIVVNMSLNSSFSSELSALQISSRSHESHSRHLSRDQRLQVHTLRDVGYKLQDIARLLGITYGQAQYSAAHRIIPKKRSGRPAVLSEEEVDKIELFVVSTQTGRLMAYTQLALRFSVRFGRDISFDAVKGALTRREYKQYVARQKPPLLEANKRDRLQFALDYLN